MMAIGDPLFLLLNGEIHEELRASVWARGYVDNAPHDGSNLEAKQAEGHVGEALALLREFSHIRPEGGVIDIQRLQYSLACVYQTRN